MDSVRVGVTILPELPWREAAPRWRTVEELGFAHAWTYDHITWSGLPSAPWHAAMPTLTAAATVTEHIGLGTFVASPNTHEPVQFARELAALDDLSHGRVLLGLGKGGDTDAAITGAELSLGQRSRRFREFVRLLDRLTREEQVSADGEFFSARDVHTAHPVRRDDRRRMPFILAANGPKAIDFAARHGDGWVTTGPMGAQTQAEWWAGVAAYVDRFETARRLQSERHEHWSLGQSTSDHLVGASDPTEVDEHSQRSAGVEEGAQRSTGVEEGAQRLSRNPEFLRVLNLDAGPVFSLSSVDAFEDALGRASALGFTDVVTHWPRPGAPGSTPYAGTEATLEAVAAKL